MIPNLNTTATIDSEFVKIPEAQVKKFRLEFTELKN